MDYELPWTGEPFSSPVLAFDTETATQDPAGRPYDLRREIPPLVLATVSDGERSAVIHPRQLGHFVDSHSNTLLVGHNIQFDYWVVLLHFEERNWSADEVWKQLPDKGLMDDTMYLDFLVRLGTHSSDLVRGEKEGKGTRNLGEVARDYGLEADKESPYRLRFHELIGRDWSTVDRGFFDYAVEDARVTWHVYDRLSQRAMEIAAKEVRGKDESEALEAIRRHGLLTSKLQTRASIVLSQVGRNGMAVDRERVTRCKAEVEERLMGLMNELADLDPPLFKSAHKYSFTLEGCKNPARYAEDEDSLHVWTKTQEIWAFKESASWKVHQTPKRKTLVVESREPLYKFGRKAGTPTIIQESLRVHLRRAVGRGVMDSLPKTPKTEAPILNVDTFQAMAPEDPFISKWAGMVDEGKVRQFLYQLDGLESVHPRFRALMKTGRTSCTDPNLQQMPKGEGFRENFIARPGCLLIIADYSAIELITLAAVLEKRYGHSVLAQVLREGRKPHDYTASLMTGISYEEMVAGVKKEKQGGETGPYSRARQSAKAINFGVPGGLGADKLVAYAKTNYGVDLLREQAQEFRQKLIKEIYPELSLYLQSDDMGDLARNLRCDRNLLCRALGLSEDPVKQNWEGVRVVDVIARGGVNKDGKHKALSWRTLVWSTLQSLNQNPDLEEILRTWKPHPANHRLLVGGPVTTLTGRVRAGAEYTEARNTPFQGLAADGAKVALWLIHRAGYKIVHFVHDEIVVEAPEERAEETKEEVVRLMKEGMSSVLDCDIPVEIEAVTSKTWTK